MEKGVQVIRLEFSLATAPKDRSEDPQLALQKNKLTDAGSCRKMTSSCNGPIQLLELL